MAKFDLVVKEIIGTDSKAGLTDHAAAHIARGAGVVGAEFKFHTTVASATFFKFVGLTGFGVAKG